jgi:hypothetical protein
MSKNQERQHKYPTCNTVCPCSMDMQHVHAAWTSSTKMLHRYAAGTCSRDMQDAAWTSSISIQHGLAAWACDMDMRLPGIEMQQGHQQEHTAKICSKDVLQGHCSNDMQQGLAACPCCKSMSCSMDMQRDMQYDMQYRHAA